MYIPNSTNETTEIQNIQNIIFSSSLNPSYWACLSKFLSLFFSTSQRRKMILEFTVLKKVKGELLTSEWMTLGAYGLSALESLSNWHQELLSWCIGKESKRIQLGTMRLQVRPLASLSALRIQHCCELWCRPAATALIRPLAWDSPYATGAALKQTNKKEIDV